MQLSVTHLHFTCHLLTQRRTLKRDINRPCILLYLQSEFKGQLIRIWTKKRPFYLETTPNFKACLLRVCFCAANRLLIIVHKLVSSSVVDILSASLSLRKLVSLEVLSQYSHFVMRSFHVLRVAVEAPVSRVCLWAVLHPVPLHVEP